MMAGLQHAQARPSAERHGWRAVLADRGNAWNVYRVSEPGKILQTGGGMDLAKNAVVTPNRATTDSPSRSDRHRIREPSSHRHVDIDVTSTRPEVRRRRGTSAAGAGASRAAWCGCATRRW
jgi:hypothetical protein